MEKIHDPDRIRVLDWSPSSSVLPKFESHGQVDTILARPNAAIRLIFAPLDTPNNHHILHPLLIRYAIPPEFIEERKRSVTHAFGFEQPTPEISSFWIHFLCKFINLTNLNGTYRIQDPRYWLGGLNQGDDTWLRTAVYMQCQRAPGDTSAIQAVTMIVFSPPGESDILFEEAITRRGGAECLHDPFFLFATILGRLWQQCDDQISKILVVLKQIEVSTFVSSSSKSAVYEPDFTAIHNISNHITHLRESIKAFSSIVRSVTEQHADLAVSLPHDAGQVTARIMQQVRASLLHKANLCEGSYLRLESLESRIRNLINLSFNLVIQRDSHVMKDYSRSMRSIAVVTLIFVPLATVSAFFGSGFFYHQGSTVGLRVTSDFWVFWAVTVPLSIITILIYGGFQFRGLMRAQHVNDSGHKASSYSKRFPLFKSSEEH